MGVVRYQADTIKMKDGTGVKETLVDGLYSSKDEVE